MNGLIDCPSSKGKEEEKVTPRERVAPGPREKNNSLS